MCKRREALSMRVLIGRGLVLANAIPFLLRSSLFNFEGACILTIEALLRKQSVFITVRSHPFPFRTRSLSSLVPKILGWKRPGKIGNAGT